VSSRERRFVALVVLVVSVAATSAALADGDPASDYLITQPMFVPFGNHTTTKKATELDRLLLDAKAKGFPLKVAVIASPYDLGSIPSLFRQPQRYASFLGQEDYYFFKAELLVVMPNGYGLYKAKTGVPPADKKAILALRPPGTNDGDGLIAAAERAVQALAKRRGLTVSATAAAGSSGSSEEWSERAEIAAGVLAITALGLLVRFAVRRRRRSAA
jgi:hypothetical protein